VLKGAAAGVFAPFMREVLAQNTAPMRLVLVVECNCFYPDTVLSAAARTLIGNTAIAGRHNFNDAYPSTVQLINGDALSTGLCLDPLAASSGNISLEGRSAVVFGLSSTITGGGHQPGTGGLSCAVDGAGATFDAVVAPRLKGTAPFDAIRLGTSAAQTPIVYQTCAYGPRKPAGILVNPALAYSTIFGSLTGDPKVAAQRAELFTFAHTDAQAALSNFRGNSNERAKLEKYVASLETLLAREGTLMSMKQQVQPLLPVSPSQNPLLMGTGTPDAMMWLEAQFQIATTSLLGGLTNVVVLASGTSGFDIHYESIIPGIGRHDLQHGIGNAANWTAITAVTRKHVSLISQLARTLAATPEVNASGSMLDHTAIVYMSDNGEQHHSTAVEWPIVMLGGNALGLKTDGRTVVYPGFGAANNRQVSNLFNSLGHAFGDSMFDLFGLEGPSRIAPGPLSELYA
jgi:hypothetical protein